MKTEGFDTTYRGPGTIDQPLVFHCGDIMYDNSLYFSQLAREKSTITETLGVAGKAFILTTVHRNTNTDDPVRLKSIFDALNTIAEERQVHVVVPLHPRTRKYLAEITDKAWMESLVNSGRILITEPVGFLDMIRLEQESFMVVTDSGGVQKEAFFFQKPCVVLRDETEWVELIETGAARLAGADYDKILEAVRFFMETPPADYPPVFGDGNAGEFICQTILEYLN